MEQITEMGRVLTNDIPLDKMLWAPGDFFLLFLLFLILII